MQNAEDEIVKELRKAQQELQRQVIANQKRRQRLVPLIEEAMAVQREERAQIEKLSQLEDDCLRELVLFAYCCTNRGCRKIGRDPPLQHTKHHPRNPRRPMTVFRLLC